MLKRGKINNNMRDKLFLVLAKFIRVPDYKLMGTQSKLFTYKELNIRMNIKELIKRIKLNAFIQMQTARGCQIKFSLFKNKIVSLIIFGLIGRIDHISILKDFKYVLSIYFDNNTIMMHHSNLKNFQIPFNFEVVNEF